MLLCALGCLPELGILYRLENLNPLLRLLLGLEVDHEAFGYWQLQELVNTLVSGVPTVEHLGCDLLPVDLQDAFFVLTRVLLIRDCCDE